MTIRTFTKIEKSVAAAVLPCILLLLLSTPIAAQQQITEEGHTTNVKWVSRANIIVITYDLSGSGKSKYEVFITLRKENDSSFAIIPRAIEGHIGEGVVPGTDREAQWYYRRDYPIGFSGKGYYFEIHVKKKEEPGNLIYYIAGGAAVVGGIVAIIASSSQPGGPPPPGELPMPPVRP